MPLHDWTRVDSGLYHDFHQTWTVSLKASLNAGLLPPGYSALVEQRTGALGADVLTIDTASADGPPAGGVATQARPRASMIQQSSLRRYARKANRVAIRHRLGKTVAVIEIVSPGNKSSQRALDEFVAKSIEYLEAHVHLLIVDPFPPGKRDPNGLHALIWDAFSDETFEIPRGKDRLAVGYEAGEEPTAFIESLAVGESLPEMPLFPQAGQYIPVPLESTYAAAWAACPTLVRELLERQ